jgi:putative DNA primase/helicase
MIDGDLAALKSALKDNADSLLLDLFGEPSSRSAREWRWGNHGSMSCLVDRGLFYTFEGVGGGSLLDAIVFAHECDFSSAVTWARRWLGEDPAQRPMPQPRPTPTFDADAERQRRLDAAATLWRRGRRIDGNAAGKYLQARGIDRWPDDCARFVAVKDVHETLLTKDGRPWSWWQWPAIVFPARNDAGEVVGVQCIALRDDGRAVLGQHGKKIKRTCGPVGEGAVRFAGADGGPLLLAEGPETALSVWFASGLETYANLGSIAKAPLAGVPVDRPIVVCQDDDPRWSTAKPTAGASRRAIKKAIKEWRREGRPVVVATPWAVSREDKTDFNDVLQREGAQAVRGRIDNALQPERHEPGLPAEVARAELGAAVKKAVDDLLAGRCASPAIVRATLGLGKSHATLEAVMSRAARGFPAVIAAPTHRLTSDLMRTAQDIAERHGVSIGVWRGRKQPDPENAEERMCRNFDVAELARTSGLSVGDTVCATCEHRDDCGYLKQLGQLVDVWFVTHGLLFSPMPKVMEATRLLVVDEDITLPSIESAGREDDDAGPEDRPVTITPADLREPGTVGTKRPRKNKRLTSKHVSWREKLAEAGLSVDLQAELKPLHEALACLAESHGASSRGEFLARAALIEAGITHEKALQASQLNRSRMSDAGSLNDLTADERVAALKRLKPVNVLAAKLAALWKHIADLLGNEGAEVAGRIRIVVKDGTREIHMQGVRPLGEGWKALPALHLDATADVELSRVVFPDARLAADIKAAEPHTRYHQVVGKAFGKGSLVELPEFSKEQKTTARRLRDSVRRDILRRIAGRGGTWLVVTHEAVARLWRETMPKNVAVEWFGNLRGLNAYSKVDGIFIVGRWGLPPAAAENLAAALTGWPVERVEDWYPQKTVTLEAADGTARSIEVDEHPDVTAEAVRRATVVAELIQAPGRGRGVQRGPDSPLDVTIYGNVALPVELATLTEWTAPSFDEGMLGEFGVALENAGDAAQVAGKTREAVKKSRQRLGTNSFSNIQLYGNVPNLPAKALLAYARYRRKGAGRSETSLKFDPMRHKDIGAWLQENVGEYTLTALHKPGEVRGATTLNHMIRCQITGRMNFGCAPTNVGERQGAED